MYIYVCCKVKLSIISYNLAKGDTPIKAIFKLVDTFCVMFKNSPFHTSQHFLQFGDYNYIHSLFVFVKMV